MKDRVYLEHILEAIEQAEEYVRDLTLSDFSLLPMVQDAVIRKIEVIGEAAKNLSPSIRRKYSHVPWKKMAGMRDYLSHKYFGVDYELVWQTCKQELPKVKDQINDILTEMDQ